VGVGFGYVGRAVQARECEDHIGTGPPLIDPEIARFPKSTLMTFVLARGGPVPTRSSQ